MLRAVALSATQAFSDITVTSIGFSATLGGSGDLFLQRDAANVLAQRNGTNAQTFRVYNTYTDSSNYERGFNRWNSNVFEVGTESAGTGTYRAMALRGNGVAIQSLSGSSANSWFFNNSGHLITGTDNTYDIGASGATRPRRLYLGTALVLPEGTVTFGAADSGGAGFRVLRVPN